MPVIRFLFTLIVRDFWSAALPAWSLMSAVIVCSSFAVAASTVTVYVHVPAGSSVPTDASRPSQFMVGAPANPELRAASVTVTVTV